MPDGVAPEPYEYVDRLCIDTIRTFAIGAVQAASYQRQVLPPPLAKISLEAGATFGRSRWVDHAIGIDGFGASGPGGEVLAHVGIALDAVAEEVAAALVRLAPL